MRLIREEKAFIREAVLLMLPMILQNFVTFSMSMADTFMVGVLGETALAAVTMANSPFYVMQLMIFGVQSGMSVLVAQYHGRGDQEAINRVMGIALFVSTTISGLLAVTAFCIPEQIMRVLTNNADLIAPGAAYTRYVGFSYFFSAISGVYIAAQRSTENPRLGAVLLTVSGALNIFLNWVLIYGKLGAPMLGCAGAAIATVSAQLISTLGCFAYAFSKYPELRLHQEDWQITRHDVTRHLIQGIPLGLQFSVLAIGIIVMQRALVGFDIGPDGIMAAGNPAQNGFGAANKLNNFLMCPMNALSTAIVSFNAQNLGAGRHDRIRRGTVKSLLIGLAMYLILGGAGMLLTIRGAYQYLFMSADKITAATIRYGNLYLYVDLSMYFALMVLFVFRSGVQGVGHAEFTLVAGCAELIARVLICAFLPKLVNGGAIDSSASVGAYIALCFGDPGAWVLAVVSLIYPVTRYLFGGARRKPSEHAA